MTLLKPENSWDIAVIGAGVFGAWTTLHLQAAGYKVALVDAYGAGHTRSSSGGESRIIRMSYGADEIYTRWAMNSLTQWRALVDRIHQPLFRQTGMLMMARDEDSYTMATEATLTRCGVIYEKLNRSELEQRWPQISFGPITWALFEPDSGVLLARRATAAVASEAISKGVPFLSESVIAPTGSGKVECVTTQSGKKICAGVFIFACGPWLPKLFPTLLGNRFFVSRQDEFYFGTPAGNQQFAPPQMPAWIDFSGEIYGIPDLENRGFKTAPDRHGAPIDPDSEERLVNPDRLKMTRQHLAERFPALKNAPLIESRVCQYENTSNGNFLIDRHPDFKNVWLVGGGSGHGFKHGPALGEYVTQRILSNDEIEARFKLAAKETVQNRSVF